MHQPAHGVAGPPARNAATGILRVGAGEFAPVSKAVFTFSVSGLEVVNSWLRYLMRRLQNLCKRQESGFRIPGFRLKTPPEPRTLNPSLAQTGGFASASDERFVSHSDTEGEEEGRRGGYLR